MAASEGTDSWYDVTRWGIEYNRLVREARSVFPRDPVVGALEEIADVYRPDRGYYGSGTVARAAAGLAAYLGETDAAASFEEAASALGVAASKGTDSWAGVTRWGIEYNRLVREVRSVFPRDPVVDTLEEISDVDRPDRGYYGPGTVARAAHHVGRYLKNDVGAIYGHLQAELSALFGASSKATNQTPSDTLRSWRSEYNEIVRAGKMVLKGDFFVQALEAIGGTWTAGTVAAAAGNLAHYSARALIDETFYGFHTKSAEDLAARASGATARTGDSTVRAWRDEYHRLVREAKRIFPADSPVQSLGGIGRQYDAVTVANAATQLAVAAAGESERVEGVRRIWNPRAGSTLKDCSDCPEMVVVPDGGFWMGSLSEESGRADAEGPVHRVEIQVPFAIGVHEVGKREFEAFVSDSGHAVGPCEWWDEDRRRWQANDQFSWRDPGFPQGDDHPVVCVNLGDATEYVGWLTRRTGHRYRLLSEAEWEYAARAGTTTPYHFGDTISTAQANFDGRAVGGAFLGRTAPGGSYHSPNRFGLHDMHGNAWEMVADCWNDGYQGAPLGGGAWKTGDCRNRVIRGGAWFNSPESLRSAGRAWTGWKGDGETPRTTGIGFRIARPLAP